MDRYSEVKTPFPTQTIESAEDQPLVIEYTDLVDVIQLSVARQIGVPGALEAQSLEKTLVTFTEEQKIEVLCEVGRHFDEALVHFVMAAAIKRRQRPLIILAEETEGINGYLPWQAPLERCIADAESNQTMTNIDIRIERITKIEQTASEFGRYACEQTMAPINS